MTKPATTEARGGRHNAALVYLGAPVSMMGIQPWLFRSLSDKLVAAAA